MSKVGERHLCLNRTFATCPFQKLALKKRQAKNKFWEIFSLNTLFLLDSIALQLVQFWMPVCHCTSRCPSASVCVCVCVFTKAQDHITFPASQESRSSLALHSFFLIYKDLSISAHFLCKFLNGKMPKNCYSGLDNQKQVTRIQPNHQ